MKIKIYFEHKLKNAYKLWLGMPYSYRYGTVHTNTGTVRYILIPVRWLHI